MGSTEDHMKLLHTADWQIGRQYARFGPEDGPALADARISTVARIAQLAHDEAYAAVLVAGDVFDAQTLSDRTLRRLFNATEAFAGPWIMIPGNHDAALAESVWSKSSRLGIIPDNVHVALTAEVLSFPELGFAVLPAPLTQRQTHDDLTAWFDRAETPPDLLRIGLAHGSIAGLLADDIDSSNPIAADRAQRARLDYLALGDWHGTKQVDARTWYSGTPEQDRFKDNGAGQVLDVEFRVPGEPPTVTPLPMGQYPWVEFRASLQVAADVERLIEQLAAQARDSVVSVVLDGQLDLASEQQLHAALAAAEARQRTLVSNLTGLQLVPTEDDIEALNADGYVGEVIADLRARQAGSEPVNAESDDQAAQQGIAREALIILAGLLRDRQHKEPSA